MSDDTFTVTHADSYKFGTLELIHESDENQSDDHRLRCGDTVGGIISYSGFAILTIEDGDSERQFCARTDFWANVFPACFEMIGPDIPVIPAKVFKGQLDRLEERDGPGISLPHSTTHISTSEEVNSIDDDKHERSSN